MDPKQIIEAYVDDVVLLLPASQRKDVGIELRELLYEGLGAIAEAAGVAIDEKTTRAFLREFGAVGEVAARYRPAGNTLIPAREGAFFAWISICGVLFQWALSLPLEVFLPQGGNVLTRLAIWSVGSGLHAFALPGVMAVCAAIWAWRRHSASGEDTVTLAFDGKLEPMRPMQPVEINRVLWGIAVIGFAVAIPLYATIPHVIAGLPEPAASTMALDEGFVRDRAPWLLAVWAAQLALFIVVLVDGFWRPATRRAEMALNLAGAAMLVWFYFGGPMAQTANIDAAAKMIVAGVALIIVVVTAIKFWREQARVGGAKIA